MLKKVKILLNQKFIFLYLYTFIHKLCLILAMNDCFVHTFFYYFAAIIKHLVHAFTLFLALNYVCICTFPIFCGK